MGSVISAIQDTVSITQFNRGYAGKIFEEVKKSGAKVVMKNNTAECVLLSPDEYAGLIKELDQLRSGGENTAHNAADESRIRKENA